MQEAEKRTKDKENKLNDELSKAGKLEKILKNRLMIITKSWKFFRKNNTIWMLLPLRK
jgi:ribonuclease Y